MGTRKMEVFLFSKKGNLTTCNSCFEESEVKRKHGASHFFPSNEKSDKHQFLFRDIVRGEIREQGVKQRKRMPRPIGRIEKE